MWRDITAAPIGLHLGWNAVSYVVFSAGPLGQAVLIPASGVGRLQAEGIAGLLLGLVLPMTLVAGVTYYLIRMRSGGAPESAVAAQSAV